MSGEHSSESAGRKGRLRSGLLEVAIEDPYSSDQQIQEEEDQGEQDEVVLPADFGFDSVLTRAKHL
jgi:hypothetical protein